MWISRQHFELISLRAKEFREWHEERVLSQIKEFGERLAERDTIIARQEKEIEALKTERSGLVTKLIERAEPQPPVAHEPLPEPQDTWEAIMKRQIAELNTEEPAN